MIWGQFEWVMNERVKGGVSDFSDLNVLKQKLADLRARDSAAREKTSRALSELNAMSATPLSDQRGLRGMGATPTTASLTVLRAMVERDRQIAQARIARAQHLPGLSAGGSIRNGGEGSWAEREHRTVARDRHRCLSQGDRGHKADRRAQGQRSARHFGTRDRGRPGRSYWLSFMLPPKPKAWLSMSTTTLTCFNVSMTPEPGR